jgi:glycosyltransferase involved in cell wall biosynthesis
VWHIHDYVSRRSLMRRLLYPFRKKCSAAIVNSDSVARDLEQVAPGLGITRIYNAIDVDRFSPQGNRLDLDAQAGIAPAAPGTVKIGLIATFARWKGHRIFLEALSRLPAGTPVRGYIIGGAIYQTDGSQWSEDELRAEAARLGLTDKVGFTGFVEDTPAALRSLDVVVHASTQPEPFGMVIIEAMACGKPVIASQAGGAAELIADGENALAHSPGDPIALARQMEKLVLDAGLRSRLGARGRLEAERKYHRARLAEQLVAVYAAVQEGTARGVPPDRQATAAEGSSKDGAAVGARWASAGREET